jgi:putative DNA primase/helicase
MLLDQGKNRSAAGPSPDIMALRGMRLVFASETDEGQRFSSARVKWLSGADTLTGRYPHDKRNIAFTPTHLLCLLTNNKPHAQATDFPFWERLLLVDFPVSFVDRPPQTPQERPVDKKLRERLRTELPGIMAWLVRGCLEWQRIGLAPPLKVREAVSEYRKDEDMLGEFLEDCCRLDLQNPDALRTSASELYDIFLFWWRRNVTTKKDYSQKAFGKLMLQRFKRERKGGIYYYYGISVLPEARKQMEEQKEL